jgi:hypothetical protein
MQLALRGGKRTTEFISPSYDLGLVAVAESTFMRTLEGVCSEAVNSET